MIFSSRQFFQISNARIRLYYNDTSGRIVFVRFLEELKTTNRLFEINWPLNSDRKNWKTSKMIYRGSLLQLFGAFELLRSEFEDSSCRIPIKIPSEKQMRYFEISIHLFIVFIVFVEFSVRVHRIWLSTQFCTDFWYYCKFLH